ncbi:hypothetical protein ACFE04_024603 [Oxalis oulophora]
MKQKMVIEVEMHDDRCRSKAMEICASTHGIFKMEIQGSNKNQVAVTGDGFDPIRLASKLRKKFGHASIISVAEEKENTNKEKEKEKEKEKTPVAPTLPLPGAYYVHNPSYYPSQYYNSNYAGNYNHNYPSRVVYDSEPGCSIM